MTGRIGTTLTQRRLAAAFGTTEFTSRAAHAVEVTRSQLASAVRARKVHRVRRDLYVVIAEHGVRAARSGSQATDDAAHVQRLLVSKGIPATIGGRTAADYWGLPVLGVRGPLPPAPPTFWVPPHARRAGERNGIRFRYEEIPPAHIVTTPTGVAVTTPLRTAIDVVRLARLPRHLALATLCAAVRKHIECRTGIADDPSLITDIAQDQSERDEVIGHLLEVLSACPRWGSRSVLRCVSAIDARIESPLEALSWGRFHDAGIPLPTPQAWVTGASGRPWRVDFLWAQQRVVGEADGRLKYAAGKGLWEEKEREFDISGTGLRVVRWGFDHALKPQHPVFVALYRSLAGAAA